MATNNVLEVKISGLEQELSESRDSIRRLAGEANNLLAMVSRLSEDVNKLKAETANVKAVVERQAKSQLSSHRYE